MAIKLGNHAVGRDAAQTLNGHDKKVIAVILVHGIGSQEKGTVSEDFVKGLTTTAKGFLEKNDDGSFDSPDRTIRIYEVHWADIAKKERNRFDLDLARKSAWFPWLNLRRGLYGKGVGNAVRVVLWWPLLMLLLIALQFLYRGVHILAAIVFTIKTTVTKPKQSREEFRRLGSQLAEAGRDFTQKSAPDELARGWIDDKLDIAGDLFNYVKAAATESSNYTGGLSRSIENRLSEQLRIAEKDGCNEIQIVAHSLGTVIVYRCLARSLAKAQEYPSDAEWTQKLTRIHTLGCPLEKIRYFWPKLVPETVADGAGRLPQRRFLYVWNNFANPLDLVSGRLVHFGLWGCVDNHDVWGVGGLGSAHGRRLHQEHPTFQRLITAGIVGHYCPVERNLLARVRSFGLMCLETLGVGMVLALAFLLGLGSISWPFMIAIAQVWETSLPVAVALGGLFVLLPYSVFLCRAAYAQARLDHPDYCFGSRGDHATDS